MNGKIKSALIGALRSGKYNQTTGRLRRGTNDEWINADKLKVSKPEGFCVLGVLCDVLNPEGWLKTEQCRDVPTTIRCNNIYSIPSSMSGIWSQTETTEERDIRARSIYGEHKFLLSKRRSPVGPLNFRYNQKEVTERVFCHQPYKQEDTFSTVVPSYSWREVIGLAETESDDLVHLNDTDELSFSQIADRLEEKEWDEKHTEYSATGWEYKELKGHVWPAKEYDEFIDRHDKNLARRLQELLDTLSARVVAPQVNPDAPDYQ